MCMQSPYDRIKALIGSRMDKFARQWDMDGIIYENDFGISSVAMENEWQTVIQLLREAGCEVTETMVTATEVEGEGWMYAAADLSRYEPKEVEEMIRRKFRQGNS